MAIQPCPSSFLPGLSSAGLKTLNKPLNDLSEYCSSHNQSSDDYDERDEEYEKKFAVRWLTNLITLLHEKELDNDVLSRASNLLAICSGASASGEHVRSFELSAKDGSTLTVQIRDGSINSSSAEGSVSVGVQTWGSASILAQLIASSPNTYLPSNASQPLRVLEVGAGTGLVSLATARIMSLRPELSADIIATDHDTAVIDNLRSNIARNGPFTSNVTLTSQPLDWQWFLPRAQPLNDAGRGSSYSPSHELPFDDQFDVILGADIVYEAHQAFWLNCAVRALLRRPEPDSTPVSGRVASDARFHLVIPLRATHEDETASVLATFPPLSRPASRKPSLSTANPPPPDVETIDHPHALTLALVMIQSEELESHDRRRPMRYLRCEIGWAYV